MGVHKGGGRDVPVSSIPASIGDSQQEQQEDQDRLRSTAKYSHFHPTALATSHSHTYRYQPYTYSPSLGAISSTSNTSIILFHISQPYAPLLVYHSTHNNSHENHLKFSHDARLLAASYDSSVLVYDCTGDALQPLLTRMSHYGNSNGSTPTGRSATTGATRTSKARDYIRCVDWKRYNTIPDDGVYHQHQSNHELITCTENVVAQWDIRQHSGGNGNSNRPSLSFYGKGFVSILAEGNEIAALSGNGVVSVYDCRKNRINSSGEESKETIATGTSSANAGEEECLYRFRAHEIGVGLEKIGEYWTTWGLDIDESASVKIWNSTILQEQQLQLQSNPDISANDENYWYMGEEHMVAPTSNVAGSGELERKKSGSELSVLKLSDSKDGSGCVGEVEVEDLSTVKLLSFPIISQGQTQASPFNFVTISNPSLDIKSRSSASSGGLWRANLWMASSSYSTSAQPSTPPKTDYIDPLLLLDGSDVHVKCITKWKSDDPLLTRMVSKDPGHLIAAELSCLVDASSMKMQKESLMDQDEKSKNVRDDVDDSSLQNFEMIMCCLTSKGYVTTHAIPETATLYMHQRGNRQDGSAPRTKSSRSPYRYHYGTHTHTNTENGVKIYRNVGENDMTSLGVVGRKRGKSDADLYMNLGGMNLNSIEGWTTQFDMDDEYPYDAEWARDLVDVKTVSGDDLGASERFEMIEMMEQSNQPQEVSPQKAAKVPSPRICGAVFGLDGRLLTFNNGNVKSMWKWYTLDSSDQSPLRNNNHRRHWADPNEGLDSEGLSKFQHLEDGQSSSDAGPDAASSGFPHTFLDLMQMNEAAKVYEWGGNDRDGDSAHEAETSQSGNESDETPDGDSDDSSDSGSDDSYTDTVNNIYDQRYDSYFGKDDRFDRSMAEFTDAGLRPPKGLNDRRVTFASTRSTFVPTLEASVYLTDAVQRVVMNGQCPELADRWMLGPWKDSRTQNEGQHETDKDFKIAEDMRLDEHIFHSLQRAKSMPPSKSLIQKRRSRVFNEDANTSEWETIGFSFQERDSKGNTSSQSLDQKLLRFKEEPDPILPYNEPRIDIIEASKAIRPDCDRKNALQNRRDICIHNSKCATAIGQHDKADVWNLLSEMIDSISADDFDDFDGWHSLNGGALGRELLVNILRYYELVGDIQMLATIVTVLGTGCNTGRRSTFESPSTPIELLLPDDDKRCNLYIHYYSQLLYSWGKLTTRMELNKHLTSQPSKTRNKDIFAPYCKRCDNLVMPETNVCNMCCGYAFRCSICTNSVRGLFTVCVKCGHGGHQNHIMDWFGDGNTVCPTGCGCTCTLTTLAEPVI